MCGISPHFVRSGDISFFIYLFTRAKCSHVFSSGKGEDPGNEKAVYLSPKNLAPFCFILEMFVASLTRRFVSAKRLFRDHWPRTFHKYLTIVSFCINFICERGNPAAVEGQTVNIKNLRTGLWSTLGVMLNEFAYEFRLKVNEEFLGNDNAASDYPRTLFDNCLLLYIICFSTTIP